MTAMDCIVLDQGNTSLKWGLFKENNLIESGRIFDENLEKELKELQFKFGLPFFYSSVRNEVDQNEFLFNFPFCTSISSQNFPKYNYTSGEAGKDRLANIAGAFQITSNNTCLVVDFGTCITYSIGSDKSFLSGAISLGVQSRLRAMHEFTGKLPFLKFSNFTEVFDNSTQGAILSSVNFGILSELKGYLDAALMEFPEIPIVFTGTDSLHFAKQLNYRIFVELNLTLIGLYTISCANEY